MSYSALADTQLLPGAFPSSASSSGASALLALTPTPTPQRASTVVTIPKPQYVLPTVLPASLPAAQSTPGLVVQPPQNLSAQLAPAPNQLPPSPIIDLGPDRINPTAPPPILVQSMVQPMPVVPQSNKTMIVGGILLAAAVVGGVIWYRNKKKQEG